MAKFLFLLVLSNIFSLLLTLNGFFLQNYSWMYCQLRIVLGRWFWIKLITSNYTWSTGWQTLALWFRYCYGRKEQKFVRPTLQIQSRPRLILLKASWSCLKIRPQRVADSGSKLLLGAFPTLVLPFCWRGQCIS